MCALIAPELEQILQSNAFDMLELSIARCQEQLDRAEELLRLFLIWV